jgi:hypothetical protein
MHATWLTEPRLRLVLRLIALCLGAVNAVAGMAAESMSEDGIQYLDQGEAWMRGDWAMAVNGTWSPLYPVIVGAALRVVRPSIIWEFPLVHVVNFGVFVLALACFEFFWRVVMARYDERPTGDAAPDCLPRWTMLVAGYALFIWSSTALIRVFAVTPDMLVAAAVFLASGLMLRLVGPGGSAAVAVALGATLGAGYLAKAAMFPLALVAFGLGAIALRGTGRTLRLLAPAVSAFLVVASPLLVPLSVRSGRFTFSDVGRTSYLRHVLRAPFPQYEPGAGHVSGKPLHPIQRSPTTPPVYRFGGAVGGTYPLAYDQGYWYAGVAGRFSFALQLRALAISVQRYFGWFFRLQGVMVGVALVMLLLVTI